jgi:hypothetical protein
MENNVRSFLFPIEVIGLAKTLLKDQKEDLPRAMDNL